MKAAILRSAGVLFCGAAWWFLGFLGQATEHPMTGLPFILLSYAALVSGAILLAKPIAGLIGDFMTNLILPGERHSRPQPAYSIPEARMASGDHTGALEAYAALAAEHPEEIAPHLRMMEIWLRIYRDPAAAATIRDNALLSIRGKKNRRKFATAAGVLLGETPCS